MQRHQKTEAFAYSLRSSICRRRILVFVDHEASRPNLWSQLFVGRGNSMRLAGRMVSKSCAGLSRMRKSLADKRSRDCLSKPCFLLGRRSWRCEKSARPDLCRRLTKAQVGLGAVVRCMAGGGRSAVGSLLKNTEPGHASQKLIYMGIHREAGVLRRLRPTCVLVRPAKSMAFAGSAGFRVGSSVLVVVRFRASAMSSLASRCGCYPSA